MVDLAGRVLKTTRSSAAAILALAAWLNGNGALVGATDLTNRCENGETVGSNIEVLEQSAENLVEYLNRGMAVGARRDEGEHQGRRRRGDLELALHQGHHFGPDLKPATVKVTKKPKTDRDSQPPASPDEEPSF